MTLYLIRHGETDWNCQKLLQGSRDIPLNERGITLAVQTAEGMQRAGLRFDRVYSSPLSRALETARILCPGQEIRTDPRLREISFGAYEGTVCPDLSALPLPPPGGERIEDLQARVMACLGDIAAEPANGGKRILVSTHGAVIRGVVMAIKNLPHQEFWQGSVSRNCGITVLEAKQGVFTLLRENLSFYP